MKYLLKKGAKHNCIINGEKVMLVGDGKVTVELNDAQVKAFRDRLIIEEAEVAEEEPEPVKEPEKEPEQKEPEDKEPEAPKAPAAPAKAPETPKK